MKPKITVVKPATVPATTEPREYRDFDDYRRAAESFLHAYSEIIDAYEERNKKSEQLNYMIDLFADRLMSRYREFDRGRQYYERPELYSKTKKEKPDLLNCHTNRVISRRMVSEQVGLLIGSFPNSTPHSPEVYTKLLIEEIIAANPQASVLESTCRDLRRTKKFAPTVAEVLEVLQEQA